MKKLTLLKDATRNSDGDRATFKKPTKKYQQNEGSTEKK